VNTVIARKQKEFQRLQKSQVSDFKREVSKMPYVPVTRLLKTIDSTGLATTLY